MHNTDEIRSVSDLTRVADRVKFLFFYGHRPTGTSEVGPECLSQWWTAPFVVDTVSYPTAEHWMMAEKARLFHDADAEAKIVAARTPGEAKKLGRLVRGFDEEVWNRERFEVVVRGNHAKFDQNPVLRDYLLATRQRVLVEASPRDLVWGIGLSKDNERAADPTQWRGLNLLGFALMKVRHQLAAEEGVG
ncbi:NADAR family protein [Spiractinospora alimapuensis]|uniref:NADAR family protein n=1 Tax=Spiractinospora alimapuensis TaxID=2820884 RepID=UPI001F2ADEC9|nr:NADAR family protein [Spiractinospora alimapuensis]QVQ54519.1 NADAR family protein [Spiractinospora alimapuensis]